MTLTALNVHNGYLICTLKNPQNVDQKFGDFIVTQDQSFPVYHIEKTSIVIEGYEAGDDIVINSIPTHVEIDGQQVFFVDSKHIVGKVSS